MGTNRTSAVEIMVAVKNDVLASMEVNLSESDGVRYLHLGTEWVQG